MPQTVIRTVTLSMTAAAMDAGDVLAATQEVADVVKGNDRGGILESLTVIDADDIKGEVDFYILDSNVSIGTEGSAPNITDANALNILAHINVAAADYKDLGGVAVASKKALGIPIRPAAGATSMYVAAITPGTPTPTAAGMSLRFGIVQG